MKNKITAKRCIEYERYESLTLTQEISTIYFFQSFITIVCGSDENVHLMIETHNMYTRREYAMIKWNKKKYMKLCIQVNCILMHMLPENVMFSSFEHRIFLQRFLFTIEDAYSNKNLSFFLYSYCFFSSSVFSLFEFFLFDFVSCVCFHYVWFRQSMFAPCSIEMNNNECLR